MKGAWLYKEFISTEKKYLPINVMNIFPELGTAILVPAYLYTHSRVRI